MTKKEKQLAGGNRTGAGRKNIYGEPTKQVGFVVPISKVEDFKKYCKRFLTLWQI